VGALKRISVLSCVGQLRVFTMKNELCGALFHLCIKELLERIKVSPLSLPLCSPHICSSSTGSHRRASSVLKNTSSVNGISLLLSEKNVQSAVQVTRLCPLLSPGLFSV
jgi:hypothetical protein